MPKFEERYNPRELSSLQATAWPPTNASPSSRVANIQRVQRLFLSARSDRRDCVAQGANPMPSYVEILTCLEMSEEANALYNPDGTARANPDRSIRGLTGPTLPAPAAPLGSEGVPKSEETPPAPKSVE